MEDREFEAILRQALQPPVDAEQTIVHVRQSGKGKILNMKNMMKKGLIAAAVMALLTTTVYASGALKIKTLRSGRSSGTCASVAQAEEKAGFAMDDLEVFSNGYRFAGARVEQTEALDEKDAVRLVYNEINVELENAAGEGLYLTAHEDQEGIESSATAPDQVRQLGEITLEYRLHCYKFVPADYEQTDADKLWLQKPGNYMSYGSEAGMKESTVAFLNWEKEGICYLLMDPDGSETAQALFSMGEELILSGK